MTKNLTAFLAMIGACEGAAYDTLYGGGKFEGDEHPNLAITAGGYTSTAAGRYQILSGTWQDFLRARGARKFDPVGQDECAAWLIERRGATADVEAGKLESAISKCGKEWASLPGSPYGQPTRTLQYCLEHYLAAGGRIYSGPEQPAAPIEDRSPEKPTMPLLALLQVFGPMLAEMIPQVSKLLNPKAGDVANRNMAAAQTVIDTVVKASGQPNVQGAIEAMQADPSLAKQVQQAVVQDPMILGLLEVGGGIVEARKQNIELSQVPLLRDRAFLISISILTLVALVVITVAFKSPYFTDWSPDNKTTVLQSILMALTAVTAFFLGSSWGSSKKDDAASANAAKGT